MRLIGDDAIAIATIYQEAENQPMEGKIAIGEVIRTRMKRLYQSDGTVVGTCLHPSAFSGWNTTSRNRIRSMKLDSENRIVQDCAVAWEQSRDSNLTLGAPLYCNPELLVRLHLPVPRWAADSKLLATIVDHKFYAD